MSVRGIVFDKDGTLVDFAATFEPATRKVLEEICKGNGQLQVRAAEAVGFDLTSNRISPRSPIVAGTGADIAVCLAPVLGINDPQSYGHFLDGLYGEICVQTVAALPGAVGAVRKLHASGFKLAIATNDAEANARSQVQKLGIMDAFDTVMGSDSGFGQKPEPGMINAFIQQSGLEPSEVVMVGDSLHDLEAGRSARVINCAVLTGPAEKAELAPEADVVLASVSDLPEWLARTPNN